MSKPGHEELMVVMLQDLVQQSLPRTFAIRHKLERGEVLLGSEIEFFEEMLEKFKLCERQYIKDDECRVVFKTVAHLLNQVAEMAMKNEQATDHNQVA